MVGVFVILGVVLLYLILVIVIVYYLFKNNLVDVLRVKKVFIVVGMVIGIFGLFIFLLFNFLY